MKACTSVWLGRLAVIEPVAFIVAWLAGGAVKYQYGLRAEDIRAPAALDAQHA